jgi:hypothetical protein
VVFECVARCLLVLRSKSGAAAEAREAFQRRRRIAAELAAGTSPKSESTTNDVCRLYNSLVIVKTRCC